MPVSSNTARSVASWGWPREVTAVNSSFSRSRKPLATSASSRRIARRRVWSATADFARSPSRSRAAAMAVFVWRLAPPER